MPCRQFGGFFIEIFLSFIWIVDRLLPDQPVSLIMTTTTLIGLGASICTGISLLPQLIKICKEQKAAEISYPMLLILMAGLMLWVWYGIKKEDLIIIISNAVSLSMNLLILFFNHRYRDRE
jgi:MtN3 and saliva related transmembrane protein